MKKPTIYLDTSVISTRRQVNHLNLQHGYKMIEIVSPAEMDLEETP
jgi:hypothetical protein